MRALLQKLRPEAEHTASQVPDIKQLAVETAFEVLHGNNPKRKAGSGEAFWQFREYQQGDLPREIDWRQSAKTERVYIRQKEQHSAQTYAFWCKQNADMNFSSHEDYASKRLASSVLALTLALVHARAGEIVGYAGQQRAGHSEKTIERFHHILQEDNAAALPSTLDIKNNASFYGFSDFLEPIEEIEAAFAPVAGRTHNGWLVQVLDPAELDLPYQGRVLFENMSAEQRTLISNASDIQREYRQRIQHHREQLQKLCARWGWRYALHRTDMTYKFTVMRIWLENAQ